MWLSRRSTSSVSFLLAILLAFAVLLSTSVSPAIAQQSSAPGEGTSTDFWLGVVYFTNPFLLGPDALRARMDHIREAVHDIPEKFHEQMVFNGVNFDGFRNGVVQIFIYDMVSGQLYEWRDAELSDPLGVLRLPYQLRTVTSIEFNSEPYVVYDRSARRWVDRALQGAFNQQFFSLLNKNSSARMVRLVDSFGSYDDEVSGFHVVADGTNYVRIKQQNLTEYRSVARIKRTVMHELGHSWNVDHIEKVVDSYGFEYYAGIPEYNLMTVSSGSWDEGDPLLLRYAQAVHIALRVGGEPAAMVRVPSSGVDTPGWSSKVCGNQSLTEFEELDTPLLFAGAPGPLSTSCVDGTTRPPMVPTLFGSIPQLVGLQGVDKPPSFFCKCIGDERRYVVKTLRSSSPTGLFDLFEPDHEFASIDVLRVTSPGLITLSFVDLDRIHDAYGGQALGVQPYTYAVWEAEARRARIYVEPGELIKVWTHFYPDGSRRYWASFHSPRVPGESESINVILATQGADRTPFQLVISEDHWEYRPPAYGPSNEGYFVE